MSLTEVPMIATALDHLVAPPSSKLLGWHLIDARPGDGWVRIGFDGRHDFCNPAGFVQGGILSAMLDDTMGPAVFVMTEVPGSEWLAAQDDKAALKQAPTLKGVTRWHRKTGVVTHVFTHFPLELAVYTARAAAGARAPKGMRWVPIATLADEALPNVMRKVIAHGLGV